MSRIRIIAFCLLLTVLSCDRTSDVAENGAFASRVSVRIDSTLRSGLPSDIPTGDGLLFILENEVVEAVWNISSAGGNFSCRPGQKRIWAIFNCGGEQERETLKASRTVSDILSVGLPLEYQGQGGLSCFLTVDGEDRTVLLDAVSTNAVNLAGSCMCAKVTVGKIVNLMTEETAPLGAENELSISSISLGPASRKAYLDGTVSEEVYNADVLNHDYFLAPLQIDVNRIVEYGGECGPYSLYCFGGLERDCFMDVSVITHNGSSDARPCHYYVNLGHLEAGYEYLLPEMDIYKEGNGEGDCTQSAAASAQIQCRHWDYGEGYDFDGSAVQEALDYTIAKPSKKGECGSVDFSCRGRLRVSSSASCVAVYGAGSHWELYARRSGSAVISVSNGFETDYETVTIL